MSTNVLHFFIGGYYPLLHINPTVKKGKGGQSLKIKSLFLLFNNKTVKLSTIIFSKIKGTVLSTFI